MELIERYVQQVGRFLPGRDRDDIKNELRSLLEDKLDDHVEGDASADTASADAVVTVLREMGSPRKVAASYSGERYLVGPELFPPLMQVLRIGLVVYVVVHAVMLVFASADMSMARLFEAAMDSLGSILGFLGATVLVFAILEWQDVKLNPVEAEWDPRSLPAADQPGQVELVGLFVGVAFNIIFLSFAFHFWRLGGVPIVANPMSEVMILPLSRRLLLAAAGLVTLQIVTDLYVFLQRRWQVGTRLVRAALDIAAVFVIFSILQGVVVALSGMLLPLGGLVALARQGLKGVLVLVVAITAVDGVVKTLKLMPNSWRIWTVGRDR